MDEMELAGHALAHGPKKAPKPMKEMHIKQLHDKTFHVAKHTGHPGMPPKEGSAKTVDELHDHIHEMWGEGEMQEKAEKDSGKGEKAGGDEETAESHPDGGQGEDGHEEK